MPALIGPIGTVVNMNQAAYGNAMGNPSYASQLAVAQGVNGQAQIIALYNQALTNTTPAALTATVMNNLFITTAAGVSQENVTAISTYLNSVFAQFPTAKGQIISNLTNILGGLEGDAAWGGAATAFNNEVSADYAYSVNPANINSGTSATVNSQTLTTGGDTVPNQVANQLITGTLVGTAAGAGTTLNIFDLFDTGAGTDTLNLNTASTATAMSAANTPTLNGVEVLTLQALSGASSLVSTVAPQLTTVNLNSYGAASAFTVTAGSSLLREFGIANSTFDANDLTVTYSTTGSTSATDTVTLRLNVVNGPTAGAANDALITFNGSGAGVNQGIETIVVNSTGTNFLESLISNEGGGAAALSALTVNGTGNLTISTALVFDATNIGTINAAGMSAATDLGVGTITLTYTGGSGNDVLRFTNAGDLNASDTINMGSGTDTIVLADTAVNSTTSVLNAAIVATGAEIIGFSAAATTVDMSAVASTQVASYQTGDGVLTFTKLQATDTVIVTQGVSTAADVTVSGQLGFTTANVTLQGSATAGVSMDILAALNLANININSAGGSAAVNTLASMTLSTNAVVTVTGTQGLTITAALSNVAAVVDGSAMTGVLTVTAGTTAMSLVGGSGRDVLTGGADADTIVGGAGNDTINTGVDGANGSSVTGGLGADAITLGNVTVANVTYGLNTTAAESFATTGQFDTVTFAALDAGDESIVTITTGLLSSTVTAAQSVTLGTTAVVAGSFLVVAATAALTATAQNASVYQDSNSNGVIDATDLRIDFAFTDAADTFAAAIVGGKLVVTGDGL